MATAMAVKERPILFNGVMVRAILEGRKTQTRRALKIQPLDIIEKKSATRIFAGKRCWFMLTERDHNRGGIVRCKHGEIGDRLWVRETFRIFGGDEYAYQRAIESVVYRADTNATDDICYPWNPSIFMPRWASRLTLEITEVRVQRLQEISERDAIAEGVCVDPTMARGHTLRRGQLAFKRLWDSINAKSYQWKSNPWVWAITFKPVK